MINLNEIKAISHDDWKALGPLHHAPEPEGDNYYDGTRREAPTRPNWPWQSSGGAKKLLGNPDHSSRRDPFTNGHGQWSHYATVLDAGGEEALKIVRQAAKDADKMTHISDRMRSNSDAWIQVEGDAATAAVIRGFTKMCGEFYPPSKGVVRQELPTKVEDIPFDKLLKGLDAFRQKRFRKRIIEDGKIRFTSPTQKEAEQDRSFNSKRRGNSAFADKDANGNPVDKYGKPLDVAPRHYAGLMGIVCDEGLEDLAAKFVNNLDGRLAVAPEKGPLWGALGDKDRVSAEARKRLVSVYNPKSNQGKAGQELIDRCDAVSFFITHEGSRSWPLLAEAARQGKAVRVFDGNGLEMPLYETMRNAKQGNLSKKEYAQSLSSHAFDLPLTDPWAFYGLKLIRDEKVGTLHPSDMSKMAAMKVEGRPATINEIADMASQKDGGGANYLVYDKEGPRLSAQAVSLLGNQDSMAAARQSLLKVRQETEARGEFILGVEDYPADLMASGNVPPYLFGKGDKEIFTNANGIVGVTGEGSRDEGDQRRIASQSTRAISSLTMQSVTTAYVQGQTAIDIPETGPQIMLAVAGSAHTSKEDLAKEDRIVAAGGLVLRTQPPVNRGYFYSSKTYNPETGKKGALVPAPAVADSGTVREAASLLGSMSRKVLVTDLNARESDTPQHAAMLSGLKADRRPMVLDFSEFDGMEAVSGNRAIHGNRGSTAMIKAGFGAGDAETLGKKFDGKFIAVTAGRDPAKAMKNLALEFQGKPMDLPQKSDAKGEKEVEQQL